MSRNRVTPKAGWVSPAKLPKGPNGRALCRWCQQEVPKGRRTFCSDQCVHEHRVRSDPGYVRRLVEDRDHGVCAECGLDTHARHVVLYERLGRLRRKLNAKATRLQSVDPMKRYEWMSSREKRWCRRVGYSFGHQWEADHIIPVAEGGGECGLENYRTLCIACHKLATAELRRRLSRKPAGPSQAALF